MKKLIIVTWILWEIGIVGAKCLEEVKEYQRSGCLTYRTAKYKWSYDNRDDCKRAAYQNNKHLGKSRAIKADLSLPFQCFPTELKLEKVYGQIQYDTKKFQTTEQPEIIE